MSGFSVSLDERDRPGRFRRQLIRWLRGSEPEAGYWEARFLECAIEREEMMSKIVRLRFALTDAISDLEFFGSNERGNMTIGLEKSISEWKSLLK